MALSKVTVIFSPTAAELSLIAGLALKNLGAPAAGPPPEELLEELLQARRSNKDIRARIIDMLSLPIHTSH
ncbi:MAG: hypothetical protein P8X85_15710 [Desulfobacterales bacterium]